MVKRVLKVLVIILFSLSCIICFGGCDINNEPKKTIEDKIREEISYIEKEILTFFSMYAQNEYGKIDSLNWNLIEENVIQLNSVLDTLILDMSETDISNESIIDFKNGVNRLSIAAFNKDINETLKEYRNLYSLIPIYAEKVYGNKNEVKLLELKFLLISSFVYANVVDWTLAKDSINSAETLYKEMMDDVEYMKEYSYNLNKVFVLLSELKEAIGIEEIELTKIKYVNIIEKI